MARLNLGLGLSKNEDQYSKEKQKEDQAHDTIVVFWVVKNFFPAFFAHEKGPTDASPDGMKNDPKNQFSKKCRDKLHVSINAWPANKRAVKEKGVGITLIYNQSKLLQQEISSSTRILNSFIRMPFY